MRKILSKFSNLKKIPTRNYFIVLVVSVLVIIISLYIRSFYLSYEASKAQSGAFSDKTIKEINLDDLDFVLTETSDAILYVSYTGTSEIYDIEKRLYKEIKKKGLMEKIIYLNVTDKDPNEYLKTLRDSFPEVRDQITSAPLFIYIKDGIAQEAMSSELKKIDYKVFNKLVEKYEIE